MYVLEETKTKKEIKKNTIAKWFLNQKKKDMGWTMLLQAHHFIYEQNKRKLKDKFQCDAKVDKIYISI